MAFDEKLAARIRELLAREGGVKEQRMFGGPAFLVGGKMAIAAAAAEARLSAAIPPNRTSSSQGRRRLSSRCAADGCGAGSG